MMFVKHPGTRPEPAVSVPSAKEARPAATETPAPELDPPEEEIKTSSIFGSRYVFLPAMYSLLKGLCTAPVTHVRKK